MNYIDNDDEHHVVLYELGQLDDMDDWDLFKKQEARYDLDIKDDVYLKYVKI